MYSEVTPYTRSNLSIKVIWSKSRSHTSNSTNFSSILSTDLNFGMHAGHHNIYVKFEYQGH